MFTVTINRDVQTEQSPNNNLRDELLRKLLRPVIVRRPKDDCLNFISPDVGLNEEVRRGLGSAVRGRRVKRGILVTALLTVNLIGGNVNVFETETPSNFQNVYRA